jgi:hypothetical protein
MDIKPVMRLYLMLAAIVVCIVLLLGNDVTKAQEVHEPKRPQSAEQQNPVPDEQESVKGYPVRKRRIGTPTDVEWNLDNSFPKGNSLLELILRCRKTQGQEYEGSYDELTQK